MKRIISIVSVLAILLTLCFSMTSFVASAESYIDNSALIPEWRPSSEVSFEKTGSLNSPDWVKELIMAEVRIETCTPEGTFQAATKMLDHYAEMGVNGLWVTPIYDRASDDQYTANGYGNYGPETVWSRLTGTEDLEQSWQIVKAFVDEAHKRNIRIFFDVVVWGSDKTAPLYTSHPEYYQVGTEVWGGWAFNWSGTAFKNWFTNACINVIRNTGADGLRCDLEPTITGYSLFQNVRDTLYNTYGTKIAIISEADNTRNATYDMEQSGMRVNQLINAANGQYYQFETNHWETVAGEPLNVVDSIKSGYRIGTDSGSFRYYTYNLLCHDEGERTAQGDLIKFGWQAIFTPFIPMWYIGEEWNNPRRSMGGTGVIYFDYIDWSAMNIEANREYFETIKQYIRIRRTYPEIFQYFPDDHRNSNICGVTVSGIAGALQAYARYMNDTAVLVVPNDTAAAATATVTIPYSAMGMGGNAETVYTVTDLMTGKQLLKGTAAQLTQFSATIGSRELGVYLVSKPESFAADEKQYASVDASDFVANDSWHVGGRIRWAGEVTGGVHVRLDADASARLGVLYNKELKIDGTHFVIDNLDCSTATTKKFAFLIGATPNNNHPGGTLVDFDADGNVYNYNNGGGPRLTNSAVIKALYGGNPTMFELAEKNNLVTMTVTNDAGSVSFELGGYGNDWVDRSKGYLVMTTQSATGVHEFDITAFHSGDEMCGADLANINTYEALAYPQSPADWALAGNDGNSGSESVNADGSLRLTVEGKGIGRIMYRTVNKVALNNAHLVFGNVDVNQDNMTVELTDGKNGYSWFVLYKNGNLNEMHNNWGEVSMLQDNAVIKAVFNSGEKTLLTVTKDGNAAIGTFTNSAGSVQVTMANGFGTGTGWESEVSDFYLGFGRYNWASTYKLSVDVFGLHGGNDPCGLEVKDIIIATEQMQEDLADAKAGDTVELTNDVKVDTLVLKPGVTLDLKGYSMTANYFVSFGDVVNGTVKVAKDNVMLPADNAALPVWNGEGYTFVAAPTFQHQSEAKDGAVVYTFLPTFDASVHEYLAAGAESSDVTVTVRLTWTPRTGGTAVQDFVYGDTFVKDVVDSYNGSNYTKAYTLTFNNATKLNNLQYSVVVVSGTGASFAPAAPASLA